MRSRLWCVALMIALLLAALMPGRVDAHERVGYRYSSVPRWAHYQPAKRNHAHHVVRQIVRQPVRRVVHPAPTRSYGYQTVMLVTGYCDYGTMADGVYTYSGAAAGGYELPFGTRVFVSGFGTVTIHDREGYHPYSHVDLWMPSCSQAIAWGSRSMIVTVYR